MSDVTLSYKGSDILELSDSGSATLKTGGTYCEADIEVEYVKPSGGGDEQGLFDLTFNYTNGSQSWSGTVEDNTIKNFSGNTFCSPPLILKKPIFLATGDSIAVQTLSSGAFFADIGFMHPFVYLAGRALGMITVASNVSIPATTHTYTYEYTGNSIIVDRMFVCARTSNITLSSLEISLSINNQIIF